MQSLMQAALGAFVLIPLLSAGVGHLLGSDVLHPTRRPLPPELIAEADRMLRALAPRAKISTSACKTTSCFAAGRSGRLGQMAIGCCYTTASPTTAWVCSGMRSSCCASGFRLLMMDARAHGASKGAMATYGWRERQDTRAIVDALDASEEPHCVFALDESMGAAMALQSAAVEP